MTNRLFSHLAAAAMMAVFCFSASNLSAQPSARIPFADPFILEEDGTYYLYGTGLKNGIGVVISTDMKTWKVPEGKPSWLALSKEDSFGDHGFWAPEVYHIGDRYYMYYTAQEHICVATSDSPLGPFVQAEKKPMREEKGIDNTIFIDNDGTAWLFWVRFNKGNEIWSAQLEPDLMTIKEETKSFCIRMSQDWEHAWPAVNEGPAILKRKGTYYLTYSANNYQSKDYGIGYATSDRIGGSWTKFEGNPVFQNPEGLTGVGHHAFFKDARGKNRIVFHSHFSNEKIHPRVIHISRWKFDSKGQLQISGKHIITPSLEAK